MKRNGHSKNRLCYHIIFSTKYRRKALEGIEQSVYAALRFSESKSHFEIIEMAVDKGDHLHLVLSFKPSLSIEQVVRRLKQFTTDQLWKRESDHLREFYWSKKRRLWTGGYFVSTVGVVSEAVVLEYVRRQAK